MRIQHNIMAMNAYRNYNNNTSALSKNLEKLSSGYKINRAGDDAAGLAISEKMRAQITGLNAAQKNVKDGVSLVKTAEGAMQEIQDMLNRMDYLATQSANGTYDNDTDRANLQKEVEQLKTEINRIADSANFNGIKLLNGSLDASATGLGATEGTAESLTSFEIAETGTTLGTSTIKHTDGVEAAEAKFGVALHELKFSNNEGETLKIELGGTANTIEIAGDGTGEMNAKAIVDKIKAAADGNDADVTFNGNIEASGTNELKVGGVTFTLGTSDSGTTLTFTQKTGTDSVDFNADMSVNVDITGAQTAAAAGGAPTDDVTTAAVDVTTAGAGNATAKYTYDFAGLDGLTAGNYEVQVAGQTVNVEFADGDDLDAFVAKVAAKLTAPEDGITAADPDTDTDASTYTVAVNGSTITFTASGDGVIATANAIDGDIAVTAKALEAGGISGDYNKQTTQTQNGVAEGDRRIASTVVEMDADTFADGNVIRIGDQKYEVSNTDDTADVYTGDLDLTTDAGLQSAIDRLSIAATSNSVWTVGQGATTGKVTFVEKVDQQGKSYMDGTDPEFDLTTEDGIKASLGIVNAATEANEGTSGKSLVLQIGDTSDEFNQMKINIGSMKTSAMGLDFTMTTKDGVTTYNMGTQGPDAVAAGTKPSTQTIADVDISDREKASDAINTIKNAINYVSGVRGDLGAIQNRLEHTQNNLSVMAENIQDAESTIRDTDVAEEMMSYVKNNILVQSAQAMLAQANQVPQGVLQLLG